MRATSVVFMIAAAFGLAAAKTVYETGFETNPDLPPGWAIESHGPGPDWGWGGNPEDWHMRVRYGAGDQDEWLLSPVFNLSGETGIKVQFWQWFRTFGNGVGQLRVSIDGGQTWQTVVEYDSDQFAEPIVPVPQANGQASVRFCWRYLASFDNQWDVDDVRVTSEVPVDMRVKAAQGPSSDDYLRVGAPLVAQVIVMNEGNASSPQGSLAFAFGGQTWTGNLPSGIAPGDTVALSFTVPGSLFATVGDGTLTVIASVPGDAVASNDTLRVSPLHVIDWFPSPGTVLVHYDDPADSALFVSILNARGVPYDCWYSKDGYLDRNLYGLEAWRVVCFGETEAYPTAAEQFSLMRFLDQPAPGLKRGLMIAGHDWLAFYANGVVSAQLVEIYLRMGGGTPYLQDMPSLFPVSGNVLGFDRVVSTNATFPDIVTTNPQLPGASLVLTYDEARQSGAMAAVRAPSYQAIAAGFDWGQLLVQDEQVALAGACVDWMLAAKADRAVGEAFRLDVAPNPATDRFVIRLPEPVSSASAVANLLDMAGRQAASWRFTSSTAELRLPRAVSAGAYCLVVAPEAGTQLSQRVIVWR